MSLRRHLILLLRWHRRLALAAAIFLVILATTGILINHSPDFGFDKTQLHARWLTGWYGIEPPEPVAFEAQQYWLLHNGVNTLSLDGTAVGECPPPFSGAVAVKDLLIALCGGDLLLLEPGGQLLERITALFGLPEQASAIGTDGERLFIKNAQGVFLGNLDTLEWAATDASGATVAWASPGQAPAALLNRTAQDTPGISLERVLLDLHSGRIFGPGGVWLFDLMALFFILIAVTGCWAWVNYIRLKNKT